MFVCFLHRYCCFFGYSYLLLKIVHTCNNAVFIIVTDEPLEELELAPPFVMMLCIEWIVVSTINIYINILVLNHHQYIQSPQA